MFATGDSHPNKFFGFVTPLCGGYPAKVSTAFFENGKILKAG
jgi:hypothetical protein